MIAASRTPAVSAASVHRQNLLNIAPPLRSTFMPFLYASARGRLDFLRANAHLCFQRFARAVGSLKMVHDLTSNDKYRGASYEGNESNLRGYGSARGRMTGSHGRSALSRLTGYLSSLVEAVADAKMRRVRRELELFAAFAWISRTRYGSQLAARAQSMIRTRIRSGNDTPATSPKTSFLNTIYIGLLAFLFPT